MSNSDINEEELIESSRNGDREAMEKLIQPYEDMIFRFLVSRLNNPHDAADLTQNTFIKALRGLPKYRHEGNFKAWLFQIARNESLNFINKRNRFSTATVDDEGVSRFENEVDETTLPADRQIAEDERKQGIRDCIAELPENEREVVSLRLDQDITFREIADLTMAPLNTVLGRMRNASRRLRDCLTLKGIKAEY